eukprot:8170948-Prorocentrum_lima.AAC.1
MAQDLADIGIAEDGEDLEHPGHQNSEVQAEDQQSTGIIGASAGFSRAHGSSSWENTKTTTCPSRPFT